MKSGIIGLPGSGKSTIFDALTQSTAESGHKGEIRIGTITVPDSRVDILSEMYDPRKTIHAKVEYYLPGITGHASDGFKDSNIWTPVRDCDALIHVVRNFSGYGLEDASPYEDFHELNQEMILADLVVVEKRMERLGLDEKRGKKPDPEEQALINQCLKNLENEIPLRKIPELAFADKLRGYAFLTAKPMLVLFNNEDENDSFPEVKSLLSSEHCQIIRGKLEQELAQMSEEEAKEFLSEFNISASAMNRVIKQTYELFGLASFFTVGEDEVRAWTIKKNTPAVEAAGVIHSDIKKGFIRAEVLFYDDLMEAGSYHNARKNGTVRLEGKNYHVQDGDIINFRFNV